MYFTTRKYNAEHWFTPYQNKHHHLYVDPMSIQCLLYMEHIT